MAYDAESFAPATPAALAPSVDQLRALPAAKALALYDLAAATGVAIVAEIAAHALAGALRRALADLDGLKAAAPAPQAEAPTAPPAAPAPRRRARAAKPAAKGEDLAAPLADPPKAKTATGAFHCVWADGSTTFVSAVPWHASKPETRWAAAFQTADRLRRSRSRDAFAESLTTAQSAVSGRYVTGLMGVRRESPEWLELVCIRPMPALLAIVEETTGATYEPAGIFGAGDAARARELESQLVSPVQAGERPEAVAHRVILRQVREAQAREAFAVEATTAPQETAEAGASVGAASMWDLEGVAVVIDLAAADRHAEFLRAAYARAKAEGGDESANSRDAFAAVRLFRDSTDALRRAAGGESLVRFTFARGTGGRTFTLTDSNGRPVRFGAHALPALAYAA